MISEIHPKNIIMVILEEVLKEQRKVFEIHLKSVGKLMKHENSKSSSHV
jgi:hypothetical protein